MVSRLTVLDWPPSPRIRLVDEQYRDVVHTTERKQVSFEELLEFEAKDIRVFYLGLATDSKNMRWRKWDDETLCAVENAVTRDIENDWEVRLKRLTPTVGRKLRCSTEFVWEIRLRRKPHEMQARTAR